MTAAKSPPGVRLEHMGRARRAAGDAIIVGSLLNELRHRVVTGVSGVSRGDTNLLTLFVIAAVGASFRRAAATPRTQVRKARSSPHAVGDTVMGVAAAKEAVESVAGHPARDVSSAAALITFAVLVHSFRPTVERSVRAVEEANRDVMIALRKSWAAVRRVGI